MVSEGCLASIIVNNYNYGRFLAEAIESALDQTYPHLEVIVVDDGSTDDSREVIADYDGRVIPVLKANGGQASAFNAGFRASRGEVVFFLDADDMLLPTAVESAVDLFRSAEADQANVVKVHWRLWEVDERGERTGSIHPRVELEEGDFRESVVQRGPGHQWNSPTTGNAWHRDFLESVLPMPEIDFRICADSYLFALASLYGTVKLVATPQGCYRRHDRNAYAHSDFDEKIYRDLWNYDRCCDALSAHYQQFGIAVDPDAWRRQSWLGRIESSLAEIGELVPTDQPFILVDQGEWGSTGLVAGRRAIPLIERDGQYWGAPADDVIAIAELERLRLAGASWVVFAWPAFWWLDFYTGFHCHLRQRYPCVLENERLVAFDLRSG
jgi:glycosyltransferase involved in cell wall biosynthesis